MSGEDYSLYPDTSGAPKKRIGRPRFEYTQQWGDLICEALVEGRSLRSICADDGMPSIPTVMKWLAEHEAFANQYARAREMQQDTYADEITFIADTEPDPQRARVRIDARKWHASKLAPKKYGDRQQIEHSGSVEHVTKEQRDAAVAAATRADE